jgi:hypothetical protein
LRIIEPPPEPTEQVAQVLEASKQARAKFPKTYRLIIWEVPNPKLDNYTDADLIYRDGVRERFARYFVPSGAAGQTPQQMLEWMRQNTPVEIELFDGERSVSRLGPMPEGFIDREPVKARITKARPEQRVPSNYLAEQYQWPHIGFGRRLELFSPAEGHVPAGLLQLRRSQGDTRFEYWVDPARDYVCVNETWSREHDGEMKKIREEQFDDFVQLPGGQWYARMKRVLDYGVYPRLRSDPNVTTWILQIDPMPADQFPPGTFDWQPLLEGAEVETQ